MGVVPGRLGYFSVASVRKMIDEYMLSEVAAKTRWIKAVPIKVNVLAWKVKLAYLPTRLNISRRGMDIESILCPMCGKALESTRHIFFTCYIARDILCKISRWWDVTYTEKWKWTSNEMACSKGSRIILGWNPDIVNVVIILFNDQVMHACIVFKAEKELFCSFIYAHNRYIQRRDLWNNLSIHKRYIRNRPWCILGDFNVSLSADESSAGSSFINTGMRDFQECVEDMEVADVNSTGLKFTWNRKPKGNDGILKKIDRIMANLEFNSLFMGACAVFQPYRISDHSSVVLRLPLNCEVKNRPFKLCNILVHNTRFKDIVTNGWSISVSGFLMYKVVKRLKGLKKPLRTLLYDKGNLHENVKKLRHELDRMPLSMIDEVSAIRRFREASFAFRDNKASGPYGDILAAFFKEAGDIHRAGFSLNSKVANVLNHVNGAWPHAWVVKYPILAGTIIPTLSNNSDQYVLRNLNNKEEGYSVSAIWNCIRPRNEEVDWFNIVWFSHQIPRYAIHLWLVIKRKLKTQDLLRSWDVNNSTMVDRPLCPLCKAQPDSHEHLFFECSFSSRVWDRLKVFTGMPNIPSDLNDIVECIKHVASSLSIRSVVCKLVFAAFCYFIWQERNGRLFKKIKRSQDQIFELIKTNVRIKLLTCSFMKTSRDQQLVDIWKLLSTCI
ncbi:RNA-directed DNA polymerase, eukaryota, reverse transcriptase zinc-binding domain protein [Tanacetum coccineum]